MAIEIINTVDDVRRLAAERDAARAELESVRTEFENWKHTVSLFAKQHGEADEEVERLRAENVELQRWKDIALADHAIIEELQHGTARLRAALLAVEWTHAYPAMGDAWCIWCRNVKPFGHRSDCERQIALGIVEVTP